MVVIRTGKGGTSGSYKYPVEGKGGKGGDPIADFRKFAKAKGITASKTKATRKSVARIPNPKAKAVTDFREFAKSKGIGPSHKPATSNDIAKISAPKGGEKGGVAVKHGTIKKWEPTKIKKGMPKGDVYVINNDDAGKGGKNPREGRKGGRRYALINRKKAIEMVEKSNAKPHFKRIFRKRLTDKDHSTYKNWEIHTGDKIIQGLFGIK